MLNRTLIDKITNIRIGKNAPSAYLADIEQKMAPAHTASILRSDLVDDGKCGPLWADDFQSFIADREARLGEEIARVTSR